MPDATSRAAGDAIPICRERSFGSGRDRLDPFALLERADRGMSQFESPQPRPRINRRLIDSPERIENDVPVAVERLVEITIPVAS